MVKILELFHVETARVKSEMIAIIIRFQSFSGSPFETACLMRFVMWNLHQRDQVRSEAGAGCSAQIRQYMTALVHDGITPPVVVNKLSTTNWLFAWMCRAISFLP
jgi:hypothetical protein